MIRFDTRASLFIALGPFVAVACVLQALSGCVPGYLARNARADGGISILIRNHSGTDVQIQLTAADDQSTSSDEPSPLSDEPSSVSAQGLPEGEQGEGASGEGEDEPSESETGQAAAGTDSSGGAGDSAEAGTVENGQGESGGEGASSTPKDAEGGALRRAPASHAAALSPTNAGIGKPRAAQLSADVPAAATVLVAAQASASGAIQCHSRLTLVALGGESLSDQITLTGEGTGTEGFDAGSLGTAGERLLFFGDHFQCQDTVIITISSTGEGRVEVVPAGDEIPPDDLDDGSGGMGGDGDGEGGEAPEPLTIRVENATAAAASVTITPAADDGETEAEPPAGAITVNVPPSAFTTGSLECGPIYVIRGVIDPTDENSGVSVQFSGDGTGTIGFDGGSVGEQGQRFLVPDEHYRCGQALVIRITDDGTQAGLSTSDTPEGEVNVFARAEDVPDPDLPEPPPVDGGTAETPETVQLAVANRTGSFVEVTFTSVDAKAEETAFTVRVPAGATTTGQGPCGERYRLKAVHLEDADSGGDTGVHTVVLTGAGTGAEGFDGENVGTDNTRLLVVGEHFTCDQTITLTVFTTNNSLDPDTLEVTFGIGSGVVSVE